MMANAPNSGMPVVAAVRYRDVAAAIDWLSKAFGCERHLVVTDNGGAIKHATLKFGNSTIRLDPLQKPEPGKIVSIAENTYGRAQNRSFAVADLDAHYARALAAGAGIVAEITQEAGGGRGYACRDLEGHVWNFKSSEPGAGRSVRAASPPPNAGGGRWWRPAGAAAGGVAIVALIAYGVFSTLREARDRADSARFQADALESEKKATAAVLKATFEAKAVAERSDRETRARLEQERLAREAATRETAEARSQAERERLARETAARETVEVRSKLEQELFKFKNAERAVQGASEELAGSRAEAEKIRGQLEEERQVRVAAELQAAQARQRLAEQLAETETDRRRAAEGTRGRLLEDKRNAAEIRRQLQAERQARQAAEHGTTQALRQAELDRLAKEEAERQLRGVGDQLADSRSDAEKIRLEVARLRMELERERRAREAAEHMTKEADARIADNRGVSATAARSDTTELHRLLDEERQARQNAELNANEAYDQAERERVAKEDAQRLVKKANERRKQDLAALAAARRDRKMLRRVALRQGVRAYRARIAAQKAAVRLGKAAALAKRSAKSNATRAPAVRTVPAGGVAPVIVPRKGKQGSLGRLPRGVHLKSPPRTKIAGAHIRKSTRRPPGQQQTLALPTADGWLPF
ncbi:MAG: VOC family protein [Hyphomicrobiaceae bacterium]